MFEKIFGNKDDEEKQDDLTQREIEKRDRFLASQRGVEKEGSKNKDRYESFKENPVQHLLDLYEMKLAEEQEKLTDDTLSSDDRAMHERNIAMFEEKIAALKKEPTTKEGETTESAPYLATDEGDALEQYLNERMDVLQEYATERWETLGTQYKRMFGSVKRQAAAFSFLALPLFAAQQSNQGQMSNEKKEAQTEQAEQKTYTIAEEEENTTTPSYFGIHNRLFTETEDGERKFNPWGVLTPFAVEVGATEEIQEEVSIDLPYRYAQQFELAEAVNPEDKEKVIEHIKQKIKQEFAHTIWKLGQSDASYRYQHRNEEENILDDPTNMPEIESIRITGLTSPEGPQEKGAETVMPGMYDKENAALGASRGIDMSPLVKQALEEMGFDPSEVIVESQEVQFNDQEMETLLSIANEYDIEGVSEAEKIFNLIVAYNDGVYAENQETQEKLDAIIDSKRMVQVELTLAGEEKKHVSVPIPIWLLLLIPAIRRRAVQAGKKIRDTFTPTPTSDGPGTPGGGPDDETRWDPPPVDGDSETRRIFSEKVSDKETLAGGANFFERYRVADEELSPHDRYLMENHLLAEEVYPYIDDEETIARGLDYRRLIHDVATVINEEEYNTDEEIKVRIADVLLDNWQQHDRALLDDIDISDDEYQLDYHHDLKKINWAKIAAENFLELGKRYNETQSDAALDEALVGKVKEILSARAENRSG